MSLKKYTIKKNIRILTKNLEITNFYFSKKYLIKEGLI